MCTNSKRTTGQCGQGNRKGSRSEAGTERINRGILTAGPRLGIVIHVQNTHTGEAEAENCQFQITELEILRPAWAK